MNPHILKTTLLILTSDFLIAGACSGGFCGATLPHIPTDMQNNTQLKPFNISNQKTKNKDYKAWALVGNGGDTITGEYRFMSGVDFNSLLNTNDKLSLFGLITNENLTSGKLAYAYTLPWHNIIVETSYIHTNYSLGEPTPGATGIGTTQSIKGKITYPFINSEHEKLNFSLSLNNNNIKEKIDNTTSISRYQRTSYSATALIDFEIKNYLLSNLNTNHKLSLGITTGDLSFDNAFNEKLDKSGANTQGSYTKININYKNTISLSKSLSLESNFRSQYALKNKNLDDSESFTIGGTNGVKLYEEGSTYDSNGLFVNLEGKYKLPELSGIKNSFGIFYDYGKIWESDNPIASTKSIIVKDAGIGLYTNYKKFFSKIQVAFKLGNSTTPTKDDEDYRALFQTGIVF